MKSKEFAKSLRSIGDDKRLDIFCYLIKNKKACVSDIAIVHHMSVAITSHHLKKLLELGLVKSEKNGKEVCYTIAKSQISSDFKKLICKYLS